MQVLSVTNLPIYLPFDKAPIPFGDAIEGVTATAAAPGVVTAPDYQPVNGDVVALSFTAGGAIPGGLVVGQSYFVVGAAGNSFSLSATKGGGGITTSSTGSNLVLHLLSGQVDGVVLPFKPGNSVEVDNQTAGSLVLQGAQDANVALPGQGYNPPSGPGTWNTIATVAAGASVIAVLGYDWIRVSTAATLVLRQN